MFLEQQISILEWFLKDHVTLKTGVMMLKIHRNYILQYIPIENFFKLYKYFHNIVVFILNALL